MNSHYWFTFILLTMCIVFAINSRAQGNDTPKFKIMYEIYTKDVVESGIRKPNCTNEWAYQLNKKWVTSQSGELERPADGDPQGNCQFYLYDFNTQTATRIKNDDIAKIYMTDSLDTVSEDGFHLGICEDKTVNPPIGICVDKDSHIIKLDLNKLHVPNYLYFGFMGWLASPEKGL